MPFEDSHILELKQYLEFNKALFNTDRNNFHIFWTTWGISMKFSGKIWLMIILKVTKNQSLSLKKDFIISVIV